MVESKEDAKNALKKFLHIEHEILADVRGPFGSFGGAYYLVIYEEKRYNVFKSDGRVENA